jgi:hypothetical protein
MPETVTIRTLNTNSLFAGEVHFLGKIMLQP